MARMSRQPGSDKGQSTPEASAPRRVRLIFLDYAKSLIVAILVALAIRTFVVQAFVIPSGSMLPTLRIGDYMLVCKFWYWLRPIERGQSICPVHNLPAPLSGPCRSCRPRYNPSWLRPPRCLPARRPI